MHISERRRASRHLLSSSGYIVLNGIDLDLETHDISACGALVRINSRHGIREGTRLGVHLAIGHVGSAVVCRASASGEGTLLALQFEECLAETILH